MLLPLHLNATRMLGRDPSTGSGRWEDHEIWAYIDALKAAHAKPIKQVKAKKKKKHEKTVTYTTRIYSDEAEKLLLEIAEFRARSAPVKNIMPLVNKLEFMLAELEEEEEVIVLLLH